MDILYKNFKEENPENKITIKQLEYIKSLGATVENVNEFLEDKVEKLEDLTHKQVKYIIKTINDRKPASFKQKVLANRLLEKDSQVYKFKIGDKNVDDFTHLDMRKLLSNDNRFNIRVQDTCITQNENYEYGYQKSDLCVDDKLYYLRTYDFMMIDYDHKDLDLIKNILKGFYYSYRIYETFNGYHVFITSANLRYNHKGTLKLMRQFKCDEYYSLFTTKAGYKIRLNPKIGRDETFVARFVEIYNPHYIEEYDTLLDILKIHDRLILNYLDIDLQENEFAKTFIDLYKNTDIQVIEELKDAKFRKHMVETYPDKIKLVEMLAPILTKNMLKPQKIIHDFENYYIGVDMFTNTFYICYKELLMIDIDFYKDANKDVNKEEIFKFIETYVEDKDLYFRIYETRNGVHLFLLNKKSDFKDPSTIQLQLDLKSDFFYVVYSYIRGWSIRLNRKKREENPLLYTHLKDIHSKNSLIDSELEELCDLHIELCKYFMFEKFSQMFGI